MRIYPKEQAEKRPRPPNHWTAVLQGLVRAHSKIVNQCVFNSLLPWYVSGDFVVHFAGLKGVWECFIFFSYFDASQEMPGMRVSDEQWARELGGRSRGRMSQTWQCMQFKTLFR